LGVPQDNVFISETATNTVANTSSTAASASSDLNGYAIWNACQQINERLKPYREKLGPDATMKQLAHSAYFDRVNLSANGFYKTPDIGYVWGSNTGQMFFYFTQGVAAAEVEIDTLTGDWTCRRADLKMDVGRSINPAIGECLKNWWSCCAMLIVSTRLRPNRRRFRARHGSLHHRRVPLAPRKWSNLHAWTRCLQDPWLQGHPTRIQRFAAQGRAVGESSHDPTFERCWRAAFVPRLLCFLRYSRCVKGGEKAVGM
jgi:hypothetical protein